MHRVLKVADARVNEQRNGKLDTGQRASDHDSDDLNKTNDVWIHKMA
jgi:hypothetical protein